MTIQWRTPPTVLAKNLLAHVANLESGAFDIIAAVGNEAQDFMKANHVWKNITGEAERKLTVITVQEGKKIVQYYVQGAPHGVFLELANSGRFAILAKTIQIHSPRIMSDLRKALS